MAVSSSSSSFAALDLRCHERLRGGSSVTPSRMSLTRPEWAVRAVLTAPPRQSSRSEALPIKKTRNGMSTSIERMKGRENRRIREPVTGDKLDRWMHESIEQIVGGIREAPFLVRIFCDDGASSELKVETEKAARTEQWEGIKKRWEQESRLPDAIVLVDELKCEEDDNDDGNDDGCGAVGRSRRRTWGLAVQGRGADCPSCYVLNTSRVKSSFGFCTHFCLARAKCFGEPWELQLRNAWLAGR